MNPDVPVIILHWYCPVDGQTTYWATCTCGWRTKFCSTNDADIKELMKAHGNQHQAATEEQKGQYI